MMSKMAIKQFSLLILSLSLCTQAFARIAFVVNPHSDTPTLNKQQLSLIMQGKTFVYPNGKSTELLDKPIDSPTRQKVYREITGKEIPQIRGQWSKKVYSGQANFPTVLGSDEEIKNYVATHPQAIGYIREASLDNSVKVVYMLSLPGENNSAPTLPSPATPSKEAITILNKKKNHKMPTVVVKKEVPTVQTQKTEPVQQKETVIKSNSQTTLKSQAELENIKPRQVKKAKLKDDEVSGGLALDLSDIEGTVAEYNEFCEASGTCTVIN